MLKDGKPVELTKEEAIRLHREMWRDMAKEEEALGKPINRIEFKSLWCFRHGYRYVADDCFLCEYGIQKGEGKCNHCPIDWGGKSDIYNSPRVCYEDYIDGDFKDGKIEHEGTEFYTYFENNPHKLNWLYSPIKLIAEAPLKEEEKC